MLDQERADEHRGEGFAKMRIQYRIAFIGVLTVHPHLTHTHTHSLPLFVIRSLTLPRRIASHWTPTPIALQPARKALAHRPRVLGPRVALCPSPLRARRPSPLCSPTHLNCQDAPPVDRFGNVVLYLRQGRDYFLLCNFSPLVN